MIIGQCTVIPHIGSSPRAWGTYITPRESEGIALTGYLLGAKQSGPESTNCHSQRRRDFHLWVGAERPRNDQEAKAMRATSGVVEPTPSGQEGRPIWRLLSFQPPYR